MKSFDHDPSRTDRQHVDVSAQDAAIVSPQCPHRGTSAIGAEEEMGNLLRGSKGSTQIRFQVSTVLTISPLINNTALTLFPK